MTIYHIKILISSSIIFMIGFLLNFGKEDLSSIIIRSLTSVTFIIMFLMITMKLNIANNKYSIFIGHISFELYLIHDRLLELLNIGGSITLVNLIIYIVVLIALSLLLSRFTNGISSLNMRFKKDEKQLL